MHILNMPWKCSPSRSSARSHQHFQLLATLFFLSSVSVLLIGRALSGPGTFRLFNLFRHPVTLAHLFLLYLVNIDFAHIDSSLRRKTVSHRARSESFGTYKKSERGWRRGCQIPTVHYLNAQNFKAFTGDLETQPWRVKSRIVGCAFNRVYLLSSITRVNCEISGNLATRFRGVQMQFTIGAATKVSVLVARKLVLFSVAIFWRWRGKGVFVFRQSRPDALKLQLKRSQTRSHNGPLYMVRISITVITFVVIISWRTCWTY